MDGTEEGCALWPSKKESFRDESANIFNYDQKRNSRAACGTNSCGFFIREKPRLRYARWFVRCNACSKTTSCPSGKGRDPFLRDYTSSSIEIGLKTNLLFHVFCSPFSLFRSFVFFFRRTLLFPFFLPSFFKRSSILVRMTKGGGVTFASYEISIGESMEDPSDYTSPLQKRRVFCPSLFGPKSENPEIQEVFEQRDTIPWTMRWNPIRYYRNDIDK